YDESIELPQPEALGLEIETLRKQNWVPLKYDNSGIVVLINNPQDRERIEKIRHLFR
ncbi:MAG: hypothetical protein GWM98_23835, partial [Nitrospinaceae bacterium]|nr:hypothetical protein [Nitrospinaceae bacterium]NIR56937.1 hypothetical protein [Nitrospinaceae bacterium]NIS87393.1 hypothetical protein [Nitrospinaceae bacterium]NIT84245.1 hypothetical protein [Nitrospinaceae bacterium]NIU46433.1 hypothetical protein [Nitrospinaceae bacterium]